MSELSLGQQRRLQLGIALAQKAELIILDGPTNHLAFELVEELLDAVQELPSAVIMTSHDRQVPEELSQWRQVELVG